MSKLVKPQLGGTEDEIADQLWQWSQQCDCYLYASGNDPRIAEKHVRELIDAATELLTDRVNSYSELTQPTLKSEWLATFTAQLGATLAEQQRWNEAVTAYCNAVRLTPYRLDIAMNAISPLLKAGLPRYAAEVFNSLSPDAGDSEGPEGIEWMRRQLAEHVEYAGNVNPQLRAAFHL
jgi:hypothetical protein